MRRKPHIFTFLSAVLQFAKGEHLVPVGEIDCKKPSVVSKALGGQVDPGEVAWQVSIRGKESGCNFCGGVVANRRWILTAAHCLKGKNSTEISVAVGARNGFGAPIDFNETPEKDVERGAQMLFAKQFVIHEDYDGDRENDIALIELKTSIQYPKVEDKFVRPACFPKPKEHFIEPLDCTVSGYGGDGTVITGFCDENTELRAGKVTSLEWGECKLTGIANSTTITNKTVCAKSSTDDACGNDSGGPLICQVKDENGSSSKILLGIVRSGGLCKSNSNLRVGFYTNVAEFIGWIQSKIARGTSEDKSRRLTIQKLNLHSDIIFINSKTNFQNTTEVIATNETIAIEEETIGSTTTTEAIATRRATAPVRTRATTKKSCVSEDSKDQAWWKPILRAALKLGFRAIMEAIGGEVPPEDTTC